MPNAIPGKCPACGKEMRVRVLFCPECATEVQGNFPLGRFAKLAPEQWLFLETFLKCRGSLKELGAQLGISYPTARNRLDNLIGALGYAAPVESADRRLEILNRLKAGEIAADEALEMLKGAKGHE